MPPQKTLVIYSGPTSMNRNEDKNGIYHDNMVYFLEHGISCNDDNIPTARGGGGTDKGNDNDVVVKYVFVLTKEVAAYYTAPDGPITKIREKCEAAKQQQNEEGDNNSSEKSPGLFIDVKTREDRCYDMESMRVVLNEIDVQASYDNLLFLNCGLVGPKLGPGSPKLIPTKDADGKVSTSKLVSYSHWSQLYTSRLDDEVRMVGQSINTHFHTFFPHVQSFLYAIKTETVPILLSAGAIYDCGLNQIEFETHVEKRFELIERYEVGMSTTLLKQGYKIATAFMNRWDMGNTLILDSNSINEEKFKTIYGITLDDTVSDLWYESGLRNLTSVLNRDMPRNWWRRDNNINNNPQSSELRKKEDTYDYHKYDLLPWDYFVFFKVSRLVTEDIQNEMNYETLAESDVLVVSPDPRKSPDEFWLRKMGVLVDTPIYVRLLKFCVGIAVCCVCYKRRRQIKSRFIMGIVSMRASKNKKIMRKKDSDIHLRDSC
jgi:hypothetical protein